MRRRGLLALALLASAAASAASPEWAYTIRPGDTLIGLGERFLARPRDWPRLQALNAVTDPYRLQPGSALRIPVAWLRAQPAPARVVALHGMVRRDGGVLAVGDRLPAGSSLSVGDDSSVTLRFADGSQATLEPNTRMTLDTVSVYAGGGMADTRLRLQQGRLDARANPNRARGGRMEVRTPSAVAAVRGTRFRVEADGGATREETLESRVRVSAARRSVEVPAGRGTVVASGRAPATPVALLAAPALAGLPTKIDSLPLRFVWPDQGGAKTWVAQIAPNAEFVDILAERRGDVPKISVGDLPDGHYQLRVRAADGLGLQGHDAVHAFEVDARPFPPTPFAPGQRVRVPSPTFTWSGVVDADRYLFQLARDADFTSGRIESADAATAFTPAAPLEPGDYHWRVASVAQGETGPFSPAQALRYDPLPAAPELSQSPLAIAGGQVKLGLSPPAAGMVYDAVLSADASRAAPVWQGESRDGALVMPRPAAGAWVLSVRARELDGDPGPWAARTLEVPASPWPLLLLPLLLAL